MKYIERTYRNQISCKFLTSFHACEEQTDLFIQADQDLTNNAAASVHHYRTHLKYYMQSHPEFVTSFRPLPEDDLAPPIVKAMLKASRYAGVGPLAAVAGAVAEFVGRDLMNSSSQVVVENGGDIFLNASQELNIAVFAGDSPLSYQIAVRIKPGDTPLGICTSSGTVGHSISFGKADAVCVKAKSAALADAAATAIGNRVRNKADIKHALESGALIQGVLGILIILEKQMGVIGDMELI